MGIEVQDSKKANKPLIKTEPQITLTFRLKVHLRKKIKESVS